MPARATKPVTADGVSFFVEERDGRWFCMKRKADGSTIQHLAFNSERAANFHLQTYHGDSIRMEATPGKKKGKGKYVLNARPDTLDFRDKMYQTSLYEVPVEISLKEYMSWEVPILDQGTEGACTGYGLATVANYLLRRRKFHPDKDDVSPRMLYELAKRYDEWAGEAYSGSSARGAMKGWHKHGLCRNATWKANSKVRYMNEERISDALLRPLGAYYRVNHKDIVAMHSAMAEVGILYATASVHEGWYEVTAEGAIPYRQGQTGGHAFAIVAYDSNGFWIQNSWGDDWGFKGFAQISYDDWLKNGSDVWVARLGAPIKLERSESMSIAHSSGAKKSAAYAFPNLRPYVISLGNDGELKPGGEYGTDEEELKSIFTQEFPEQSKGWSKRRLLLYAHGGLVSERSAVQRLADYKPALLAAEVYPVSFIWHTDAWSTVTNVLKDAVSRRKPEGFIDSAKDFMLDRLDDALELLARPLTGRMQWKEMKENALRASTTKTGGMQLVLPELQKLAAKFKDKFEIHVIAHSAGSILMAPLIDAICRLGLKVESCTLWAPACTTELFKKYYKTHVEKENVKRFSVFNLTDEAELDDHCANIYHKSLLYLVSNAFEDKQRNPFSGKKYGTPILGVNRCIEEDPELRKLFLRMNAELVLAPNDKPVGSPYHSSCKSHGDFDDDPATVNAALCRILGVDAAQSDVDFKRSANSMKDTRNVLNNEIK